MAGRVKRFVWLKEGRGSAGVDISGPRPADVAVGGRLAVCIGIFHTINSPLQSKDPSAGCTKTELHTAPFRDASWTMLEEPGTGIGGGEHT